MVENSKILVVGGTFSEVGGVPDTRLDIICKNLEGAMIINGGMIDFLKEFITNGIKDYQLVYWLPLGGAEDVEPLVTKEKKVIFKTIKDASLSDEEIGKMVQDKNCHALINLLDGEEAPKITVTNVSGVKVVEGTSFDEVTEKLKDEKILRAILHATPAKEVYEAPVITMERLHLRIVEDSIDILYRPLHSYVEFVKNDEAGKARVKELATMSRDDFAKYLASIVCPISVRKEKVAEATSGHSEEWYQKAWKMQTDNLLKELAVSNPIEEPIWR